eukprot:1296493-Rhodomonas_salina.1
MTRAPQGPGRDAQRHSTHRLELIARPACCSRCCSCSDGAAPPTCRLPSARASGWAAAAAEASGTQ